MNLRNGMAALLVSVALFGLSACENSKDKAARHLASAMALAEKGDGDRALVEFRNVFKLDPENVEARREFADFLLARGDLAGAYGQYLAVTELKGLTWSLWRRGSQPCRQDRQLARGRAPGHSAFGPGPR